MSTIFVYVFVFLFLKYDFNFLVCYQYCRKQVMEETGEILIIMAHNISIEQYNIGTMVESNWIQLLTTIMTNI